MKGILLVFAALSEHFVSVSMYQRIFFCDPSVFYRRCVAGHIVIVIIHYNYATLMTVKAFERPIPI